jgi:arylamine N-acetyltransferase
VTLQDRELTVRRGDGDSTSRMLATHEELLRVLAEDFQLSFPGDTRFVCPALTGLL